MADAKQPGAQPQMSVSEFAGKIKSALPSLQGVPDEQLAAAVFKRRPDLITQVTAPPAGTQSREEAGVGMQKENTDSIKSPIGFGPGVAAGLNPLHTPPADTKQKMGKVGTFGADMLNLREISQRAAPKSMGGTGDTAGALGMGVGMGAQAVLTEGALRGGGALMKMAGKSLESAPGVKSAMAFAKSIKEHLPAGTGVSGQALNRASRYVEPLRAKISEGFDALHQAMAGQSFFTTMPFSQTVRKMARAGEPMIKNFAKDLADRQGVPRSAMDYKEAEMMSRKALALAKQKALRGWSDDLRAIHKELDNGIQQAANQVGLGQRREFLKEMYAKITELGVGIAATTEEKASTAKKMLGTLAGAAGGSLLTAAAGRGTEGAVVGALTGERAAASTKYVLHEGMREAAEKLAKDLGVKLSDEMFTGSKSLMTKAGRFIGDHATAIRRGARSTAVGANVATSKQQQQQ